MKLRIRNGNIKGVAAVEFALILPLFLLLIMGIIDFGRYFFVQHTLQFATREGVRLGLVGKTLNDPVTGNPMTRVASIVTTIQSYASHRSGSLETQHQHFPGSKQITVTLQGWKGHLRRWRRPETTCG